jgi:hypothetical protein
MCRRLFVLMGILPGCWSETHRPGCSEPVYTELADDESSPMGISPASLLATATRGWEGIADHFGSEVDLAFAVTRGEGPALFADTEEIDVVTRRFGFGGGSSTLLLAVTCEDRVEIPADLRLVSEDADVDLAMEATIASPNPLSQGANSGADIEASVPYIESGLVVEGVDESYDDQSIGVSIAMQPAEQSTGRVYWTGTNENEGRLIEILHWDASSDEE